MASAAQSSRAASWRSWVRKKSAAPQRLAVTPPAPAALHPLDGVLCRLRATCPPPLRPLSGPSGSGKTSLLNALAGQVRPAGGATTPTPRDSSRSPLAADPRPSNSAPQLPRSKTMRVRGRVLYPSEASQHSLSGQAGGRKGYVTQARRLAAFSRAAPRLSQAFPVGAFPRPAAGRRLFLPAHSARDAHPRGAAHAPVRAAGRVWALIAALAPSLTRCPRPPLPRDATAERVDHAVTAVIQKMGLVKCGGAACRIALALRAQQSHAVCPPTSAPQVRGHPRREQQGPRRVRGRAQAPRRGVRAPRRPEPALPGRADHRT